MFDKSTVFWRQQWGKITKVREVKRQVWRDEIPSCAWCRLPGDMYPMVEIRVPGITIDMVRLFCYCAACNKGTEFVYEEQLDIERQLYDIERFTFADDKRHVDAETGKLRSTTAPKRPTQTTISRSAGSLSQGKKKRYER